MPEISRFFGIVIAMYYKEHAPPHFHAKYAGQRASFSIPELQIIEGGLPRRAISLVLEWAFLHRDELMDNWLRADRQEGLLSIEPLD
jgi:phosphomannomutase